MKTENKIHNVWDRFILKKDLPTWKSWQEMWIWEDGCLYGINKDWDVIMVYHVSTLLDFNILNTEWFETIKKSIFNLEDWDVYYYIDEFFDINSETINKDTFEFFEKDLNFWNVFLTEEDAIAELERRKAIQRIKRFIYENNIKNIEFKIYENNYTIYYNYLDKKFEIEYYEISCWENYLWYFETYEDCKNIIDNCLDDLKIIYNIKD